MGKGPTVFVRKRGKREGSGGYWSRERTEQAIRRARDAKDLRCKVPTKVLAGFLEQNFQKGTGRNDSNLVRQHFKKMPDEAIRKASGQPDPDRPCKDEVPE